MSENQEDKEKHMAADQEDKEKHMSEK